MLQPKVAHPREALSPGADLAELEARYPQLRGRTGAVCTEEFARAHGALLFNRFNDTTAPPRWVPCTFHPVKRA